MKVVGFFPDNSHDPIVYPVAATANAKPETMQYLAFLRSAAAKSIFEGYIAGRQLDVRFVPKADISLGGLRDVPRYPRKRTSGTNSKLVIVGV